MEVISVEGSKALIKVEGDYIVVDKKDVEEKEFSCAICGQMSKIKDMTETQDGYVCSECLENHYEQCADCGDYVNPDDLYETHDGDLVCSQCLHNDYTCCYDCDEYFENDAVTEVDGYYFCSDCFESRVENGEILVCQSCGEYHMTYNMYSNDDGDHYCRDCYDEHEHDNDYIKDYHDSRSPRFKSLNSDESYPKRGNLYLGREHELSGVGCNNEDLAETLTNKYGYKCEHDGSIDDGFEAISDAMTFSYWKENEDIDGFINECVDNGLEPADDCGIHVHISRGPLKDSQVEEICLFVMNHYVDCIKFGRREPDRDKLYYCSPIFGLTNESLWDMLIGHDVMVNLTDSSNLELRFFKTTDSSTHAWAILEFSYCLAKTAMNGTVDITWDDLKETAEKDGRCQNFLAELANNFDCGETDGFDYNLDNDEIKALAHRLASE